MHAAEPCTNIGVRDAGGSTERNLLASEQHEQSAEQHNRLAKSVGKQVVSSGSYTDPEFESMIANLTIDDDGGVFQLLYYLPLLISLP